MDKHYPEQLAAHLSERPADFTDEFVSFLGSACKHGRVSEQFALEMLQREEQSRQLGRRMLDAQMMTSSLEWE